MLSFLKTFGVFLGRNKRYWLFPIILAFSFILVLELTTENSTIAPFVYTLF